MKKNKLTISLTGLTKNGKQGFSNIHEARLAVFDAIGKKHHVEYGTYKYLFNNVQNNVRKSTNVAI